MYFSTKDDFKETITSQVVQSDRNFKFIKNDKIRVKIKILALSIQTHIF